MRRETRADREDRGRASTDVPRRTDVAPGREETTLRPPTDKLPEAVKKKQLDAFRKALYEERVDRHGYLRPSEGSALPVGHQTECKHPFRKL